jgi:hypothetical protein
MKFKLHVTRSTFVFLFIVVVLTFITIYAPFSSPSFDTSMIFSSVSLLFSILSGFSISILWGRQERIRSVLNDETAILYAIYYRSAALGKAFQRKIADHIDAYLIPQLDYALSEYETSRKTFVELYNFILNYKAKPEESKPIRRMLELLEDNLHNRVVTTFHAKTKLVPYLSYSIYLLGIVLLGIVFYV